MLIEVVGRDNTDRPVQGLEANPRLTESNSSAFPPSADVISSCGGAAELQFAVESAEETEDDLLEVGVGRKLDE